MIKKKKVCVLLTEEQCEKIQLLADESFRTRSGYLRRLVTVYLQAIEADPEKKIP